MAKMMKGLFIFIIILSLQTGCSVELKGNKDQNVDGTTKKEEVVNEYHKSIPYKEHIYSKYSSLFAWEWSSTQDLQKEILDQYETYNNSVPGGFIVKETPIEYFICVSIGERESVMQGFKIKSLEYLDKVKDSDPFLKIEVTPVSNENTSDNKMEGKVFVRSLISVSKKDLPDGFDINSISLRGI